MICKQFKLSQPEKEKLIRIKSKTGIQNWNVTLQNGTLTSTTTYGKNVGTTGSASSAENKSLGLTTDGTKSGIVANVSSDSLTVNIWKRTA